MSDVMHHIKMRREHFQEVWEGMRHHHVGGDKPDIDLNDTLMIQEYDAELDEPTARRIQMRVTAITRAPYVPFGWVVLSLQHISVDGHMCCNLRRDRFGDGASVHSSSHPSKKPP